MVQVNFSAYKIEKAVVSVGFLWNLEPISCEELFLTWKRPEVWLGRLFVRSCHGSGGLLTGLSFQKPAFSPLQVHVGFMLGKVALVSHHVLQFYLSQSFILIHVSVICLCIEAIH
jgi:hypothetical protein